jgi:hypothetical protein
MNVIKKTYNQIVKSTKKNTKCVKCERTEKELVNNTRYDIFSPECLCIDCEIIIHPDRFHGCGFCKRPIREKFSCVICSNGFVEWIKTVIQSTDSLSMIIRQSANGLLTGHGAESNSRFILRVDDGYYKWPGFYAGISNRFSFGITPSEFTILPESQDSDGYDEKEQTDKQTYYFPVWVIPKLTKGYDVHFGDLRLNMKIFQTILLEILEKNNINLYHDVQIDLEKMDNEQIKAINPYDTRVMKRFF